jgi:hypothetical protein
MKGLCGKFKQARRWKKYKTPLTAEKEEITF